MSRLGLVVPFVILVLSLALSWVLPRAGEERRIAGTVIDARATYCEPKKADGCTGTLTVAAVEGRRRENLTIKVPLGTPISAGCEALSLGELPGRRVVVTEVEDASGPIARAVSDPEAPRCG
jgi:hypothetical protein